MTFQEEQFPGLGNGSRPAIVLPFPGIDPLRAVTDSVGTNNAQTGATDAKKGLLTLEQPSVIRDRGSCYLPLIILLKECFQHLTS